MSNASRTTAEAEAHRQDNTLGEVIWKGFVKQIMLLRILQGSSSRVEASNHSSKHPRFAGSGSHGATGSTPPEDFPKAPPCNAKALASPLRIIWSVSSKAQRTFLKRQNVMHSTCAAFRTLRGPDRKIIYRHGAHWCLRSRRFYSSTPLITQSNGTKVNIKIGLEATIPLSIYHAPRPSSISPTVIYLPRGPILPLPHAPLSTLALSANATVVCIHYRLSGDTPYPVPIHDVLAGYDWVRTHLIKPTSDPVADPKTKTPRIGVCGELIGGSLALMLALTECRPERSAISAAAAGNPIADWTALFPPDESSAPSKGVTARSKVLKGPASAARPSEEAVTLSQLSLLGLRDKLFSKPEHYHDPFASPHLFFSTSSTSLPSVYSEVSSPALDLTPGPYALGEDIPSTPDRVRRSHRKYPAPGSALRIPHMRIDVGRRGGLHEQGEDMAERLVKSIKYWEEEAYGAVEQEALRARIGLVKREGLGLWGDREVADVGAWMGEVLRR